MQTNEISVLQQLPYLACSLRSCSGGTETYRTTLFAEFSGILECAVLILSRTFRLQCGGGSQHDKRRQIAERALLFPAWIGQTKALFNLLALKRSYW
jgi:hypothetical protein